MYVVNEYKITIKDGKLNKELLGDICEEYVMDENPIYEKYM